MRVFFGAALFIIFVGVAGISMSQEPGSTSYECLDCHSETVRAENRHFLQSSDDCMFCHKENGGGGDHRQSIDWGNQTCVVCHIEEDKSEIVEERKAHDLLACTQCHNPHGTEFGFNLLAPTPILCAETCHGADNLGISHPIGEGIPDIARGTEMTCISTCHSVHYPSEPKLLKFAGANLCSQCHTDKY